MERINFCFSNVFRNIFLRSYAGGYHADTEAGCYLITTTMMNIAIFLKKMMILSNVALVVIWIGTTLFIWNFAPVKNPIHFLGKDEQKKYARNTKIILLCNGMIMLLGIYMRQQFFMKVIILIQGFVVMVMIAGICKYRTI